MPGEEVVAAWKHERVYLEKKGEVILMTTGCRSRCFLFLMRVFVIVTPKGNGARQQNRKGRRSTIIINGLFRVMGNKRCKLFTLSSSKTS